jgi:hypothetical protein
MGRKEQNNTNNAKVIYNMFMAIRKSIDKIATTISIFAFVVSLVSLFFSYRNNLISQKANELTQSEKRPLLRFDQILVDDIERPSRSGEVVNIYNDGYPVRDFDSKINAFLQVTILEKDISFLEIPLIGYMDNKSLTNKPSEKLASHFSGGNAKQLNDLMEKFSKYLKENSLTGFIDVELYARTYYKDIFSNSYIDTYKLNKAHGSELIDEDNSSGIHKRYNDLLQNNLYISLYQSDPVDIVSISQKVVNFDNEKKY